MSLVLVTGGTGHLGRDLVSRLLADGRQVRILARSPGDRTDVEWAAGNLATGVGLEAALRGVDTVISAATHSPIAQRGGAMWPTDFFTSPSDVDVAGARRLLALSRDARVRHFVHVSIVGLDDASLPYMRAKLAGERLVRGAALPWSVVRATPFYYLLEGMLKGLRWLPVWPVPKSVFNPVDTTDVASHLVACAFDGGRGMRSEIGGPEALSCAEFARQYLDIRGRRRPVLSVPVPGRLARGMGLATAQGSRGAVSWADWLKQARPDA